MARDLNSLSDEQAEVIKHALRTVLDGVTPEEAGRTYGWNGKMVKAVRKELSDRLGIKEIYTQNQA